jgi:hypothetical protein
MVFRLRPIERQSRVVTFAEFAEKAFETSYFGELSRGVGGSPRLFSPSQVLEKLVGFDAAVDPSDQHAVWSVLNVPRPHGVSLLPEHWAGSPLGTPRESSLPRSPFSLILQYKRPEFLRGARAAQWRLWHSPYYRFTRDLTQHSVLKRLELNLGNEAIVRYASPAFHTLAQFELAQIRGTVISETGHVAPSVLANHKVWTYSEPGQNGRGNPDGPWHRFQPLNALFDYSERGPDVEATSQEVTLFDGLNQHLRAVAEVAADREPELRRSIALWRRGLESLGVPEALLSPLVDFVTVQSLLQRIGAGWFLADGNEVRPAG